MGRGIAISAATGGYDVSLYDIDQQALDAAQQAIEKSVAKGVEKGKIPAEEQPKILARIRTTMSLDDLGAGELIVEAVPESMDLKKKIFGQLSGICSKDAILASNTSSLSITSISAVVDNPGRVVGMHFFNPANIMKLVEVIAGRFTSEETVANVCEIAEKMGKTPARVKDTPGFIVNRVARSFYTESLRILEEGVADEAAIDRVMQAHGFRMGPFTLMDLIGNDVNVEVTRSLYEAYHGEARYRPSHIQEALVDAGMLGKKSGRGFYNYES